MSLHIIPKSTENPYICGLLEQYNSTGIIEIPEMAETILRTSSKLRKYGISNKNMKKLIPKKTTMSQVGETLGNVGKFCVFASVFSKKPSMFMYSAALTFIGLKIEQIGTSQEFVPIDQAEKRHMSYFLY